MVKFVWRVTAAHVVAYFIAGIFAMKVFDYAGLFSSGVLACFMKPTSEPIVALGPALQIIRGVVMGLVLLPVRRVFTESQWGFAKLAVLLLGLCVVATFGPAFGSVDGFIFTKMSWQEQISGYPEALLWIVAMVGILWSFYKFEKKALDITAIVVVVMIVAMCVLGYINAVKI